MTDEDRPIDLGPPPKPVDLDALADQLIALAEAADTAIAMARIAPRFERVLALDSVHKVPELRDRLIAAEGRLWERYDEACSFVMAMADAVHNDSDGAR